MCAGVCESAAAVRTQPSWPLARSPARALRTSMPNAPALPLPFPPFLKGAPAEGKVPEGHAAGGPERGLGRPGQKREEQLQRRLRKEGGAGAAGRQKKGERKEKKKIREGKGGGLAQLGPSKEK